jgi:hypothetical protein
MVPHHFVAALGRGRCYRIRVHVLAWLIRSHLRQHVLPLCFREGS